MNTGEHIELFLRGTDAMNRLDAETLVAMVSEETWLFLVPLPASPGLDCATLSLPVTMFKPAVAPTMSV